MSAYCIASWREDSEMVKHFVAERGRVLLMLQGAEVLFYLHIASQEGQREAVKHHVLKGAECS